MCLSIQPLNPFDWGIIARDTRPPVLGKIVLIPLDNASSVDGYPAARWYDLETLDTISPLISGKIGVAVSIWDEINNSRNLLGIYTISLSVDSTKVFSKQYTKIPFDFNGLGALDYLSGYDYGGEGYLSALFRREGNWRDGGRWEGETGGINLIFWYASGVPIDVPPSLPVPFPPPENHFSGRLTAIGGFFPVDASTPPLPSEGHFTPATGMLPGANDPGNTRVA